ncbi:MAG TPA: hypothetical protein VNW53_06865 [Phenylobacterium sp.]|jgi:hypothetical protein|uniref:hypothetical protein n=1 Tax=Phenylobacterium sp. TaxID=1871053 RepID=UPI002CE91164|nr:hypothetical protein [Phenylobacterium sp.]HXA38703.1 hypothetical protein [Phenylobacterium sp.]
MDELTRLLALLGFAGVAVTLVAGIARWRMNESRRIQRGLKAVLKGDLHGFLPALGRGKGMGFNFTTNQAAVVWDAGGWGLIYALDELMGAEVIVDGLVVGRVHRGEQRKALEAFDAAERVALRLVFDDLAHPDFVLDLWLPEDEGRRDELPPPEAIAEANRWLARIEALLRRPMTTRRPVAPAVVAATVPAQPAPEFAEPAEPFPPLTPLFSRLADQDDDDPPWDEDEDAEDRRALR